MSQYVLTVEGVTKVEKIKFGYSLFFDNLQNAEDSFASVLIHEDGLVSAKLEEVKTLMESNGETPTARS